jgi:hypothetical protein
MVSFLTPDGLVTIALTVPVPLGDTDLASTMNSVGESRKTPKTRSKQKNQLAIQFLEKKKMVLFEKKIF